MLRVLLLDCSDSLHGKLEGQGFNVESGTVGLCTGVRRLPSQVYEKDVFIYNPESCSKGEEPIGKTALTKSDAIQNLSPEYDLQYLESRIKTGATFLTFVNHLSDAIEKQNKLYRWIPFMPPIEFTSDRIVTASSMAEYPYSEVNYLAPIVTADNLSYPVTQKLNPPKPQEFGTRDVFTLLWNGHGHSLGLIILRGRGQLIVLPKFKSNEDVIDTFLHRVIPRIYSATPRGKLADLSKSGAELAAQKELDDLDALEQEIRSRREAARVALTNATRQKLRTILEDETARQIQVYFDHALGQDDAALYYLYKIVEAVENKFGGEYEGIKAVGAATEWKAVKRLANESYRDARHAPKPGDVIKKWTHTEIKECFKNTQAVVLAYFATLFPPPEETPSRPQVPDT